MLRYTNFAVILFVLCACSCKKDLLRWQKVSQLNSHTTSRLSKARFVDDSVCLIAGGEKFIRSELLRSVDGGFTWAASSHPDANKGMYDISTGPGGTIYVCGVDGIVLHSNNNGATWNFHRIPDWRFYTGVAFPTVDTGIFINSIALDTGYITQTDSSFHVIDRQTFQFAINDIYMVSPSTGYVIGYGVVMKTTDHRRTWHYQDVKRDNFTGMDIHGDEIWLCGYNGSIHHTVNGGNSWERIRNSNDLALPQYHLHSIVFKDKMNGWAAGESGKLIHTDDGGRHWAEYEHFTNNTIRDISLCPNGDLLAVGDNGIIFRITPK